MIGLVSRSLAVALGAAVMVFGAAVAIGDWIRLPGRSGMLVVIALVLAALVPLDWIPVALCARLVRRAPDVGGLQDQLARLLFEALTATALGAAALNYAAGSPLPRGAGLVILLLAFLLVSAPPVHWLLQTYRRA